VRLFPHVEFRGWLRTDDSLSLAVKQFTVDRAGFGRSLQFMSHPDQMFALADGRRLMYRVFGAARGRPLLALHGTPGSRFMFAMADRTAAELGFRLIAPDRWGYGGSDAHPRPSLAGWAHDIRELADGIGLSRLSVVGISGGGPFAVAVAALLADRVDSLALAVPVGPMSEREVRQPLGIIHHLMFRWAGSRPPIIRTVFLAFRSALERWPERTVPLVALGGPRVDRDLVRSPDVREHLRVTFKSGLASGVEGAVIDMQLFASPWQLPLDRINARTHIWVGLKDRLVPLTAARRLCQQIRHAEMTELESEGHFWIARDHALLLRWLAGYR
jgi:pimeloyl-ACP methyl ester carboxylesterase